MRKLASIQRVVSVERIAGADNIELAKVLGWQVVVKKNTFAIGDLAVFLEVDSVPPDRAEYNFLWQTATSQKDGVTLPRPSNFRLRSKRLRGVLSQGLLLPITLVPLEFQTEGADVTETLQVTKYEISNAPSAREILGKFPTHLVRKTDELRAQSIPSIFEELAGVDCYISEKLDGQSLTFIKHEQNWVCSRNYALKDIPDSPHWLAAKDLKVFDMPYGFAVQGEFVGPGIQGNKLGLKTKQFFAFNVFDIINQRYLNYEEFAKFCSDIKIQIVPIFHVGPLRLNLEKALEFADRNYSNGHPSEGIVIRPTIESISTVISAYQEEPSRTSFKVINNNFLLKTGE